MRFGVDMQHVMVVVRAWAGDRLVEFYSFLTSGMVEALGMIFEFN